MPVSRQRKRKRGASSSAGAARSGGAGPAVALAGLAAVLGLATWLISGGAGRDETVSVTVPKLSAQAARGRLAFNASCGECHGMDAGGSDVGPPLIDRIYRPGHHDDRSFRRAVARGVGQHHWPFGDMPPRPTVGDGELDAIIAFIRETQRANGIH